MPTTHPRRTPTRRLVATAALGLGLLAAPTAAGAATALDTPSGPSRPPVVDGGLITARPLLTVELDDAVEAAGEVQGRLRLSSPLARGLSVDVRMLFPGAGPEDIGCEWQSGGSCDHVVEVDVAPGVTVAPFELDVVDDGAGGEDAELVGVEVATVHPSSAVRVGPAAEAVLYDGDGLDLALVDDPEALEGDAGSAGTLQLVVETDQAVPHPVSFRVSTGVVGGYNGATPGVDHQPVDLVVQLAPGATDLAVAVPLIGDDVDEPDEILFGNLGDLSHGEVALSGGTTVARILDDEVAVGSGSRPGGYQSPSRSARSAAFTA